jgi:RNA polymerase sigma-70 factor (ECF subfamily)
MRQDDRALPRHTHLSDEALVALVARGDESALGELYDRVGRVAYGIAFRILRDDRLAEDAVQEGFLAVWRSAGTFRPERAKASTWIVTLVHRRAVDLVRREERRRAEPLEAADRPEAADPAGSAADAAWLGFERDRVQAALRTLPDGQREAIELAYYGGYSQSELAERLGVPLGTVKSRMFAGLARLREVLDDTGAEGSWTPRVTS